MSPRVAFFLIVSFVTFLAEGGNSETSAEAKDLVSIVITAAGGEEKLLRVFRMKERFNSGPILIEATAASTRDSILEAPAYWWVGGNDRTDEPAKFDVWAWTLVALTDPKVVIESLEGVEEDGAKTLGLRLSGAIDPALDLYFHSETHRLIRMDWRNDIYRFSDWRVHDGAGYQAKTVIYKRKTNVPWFYHEVTGIARLEKAPADLPR